MIVRKRPAGWQLFFIARGSVLGSIRGPLAATVALAVGVTLFQGEVTRAHMTLTTIPFTLMGLALAIFLGFRNSASYERFWEGRKLWGELLILARACARQALSYVEAPAAEKAVYVRRIIALVYALCHHLRREDPSESLRPHLTAEDWAACLAHQHRPEFLLRLLSDQLADWQRRGGLSDFRLGVLEKGLTGLGYMVGGCERILTTPLPFSYTLLLHRTAYLYCFLLPFGLVETIGAMTPVVVAIVSYTFFGLDALGDEIEEPFGTDPNDLPLLAISRTIEINLLESLGETSLPSPLVPKDFCLL